MNKKKFMVVIILSIVIVLFTIGKFTVNGKDVLVNPRLQFGLQKVGSKPASQPSIQPTVPSYNAPKEIKYDSSTNLKQELDSVNPEVLDSDFKDL